MKTCCCVCGKVLFINGDRQDDLCYQLCLVKKKADKVTKRYTDSGDSQVFGCMYCFDRKHKIKIMNELFSEHDKEEKIRASSEYMRKGTFVI